MYHPIIFYTDMPVQALLKQLAVVCPARVIMRFNKETKRLEQTPMTLLIVNDADYARLKKNGYFERDNGKRVYCTDYRIKDTNKPKEGCTADLYVRFDRKHEFDIGYVSEKLRAWLDELQQAGVIRSYRLDLPNGDREAEYRHKGHGFICFTDETSINDRCIVFSMLQNRRLHVDNPFSVLSVMWRRTPSTAISE